MIRPALILLPFLAACTPTSVPSAPTAAPMGKQSYTCDGNRTLVVEYGTDNGQEMVTLDADGTGVSMLLLDPSAPERHYSWPSDGSHPVWDLLNGVGTLSYRDGERGTTTPLLTNCRA